MTATACSAVMTHARDPHIGYRKSCGMTRRIKVGDQSSNGGQQCGERKENDSFFYVIALAQGLEGVHKRGPLSLFTWSCSSPADMFFWKRHASAWKRLEYMMSATHHISPVIAKEREKGS